MGFLGMLFNTPDGIRELTKKNYWENLMALVRQLPSEFVRGENALTEHQARLVLALALRYASEIKKEKATINMIIGETLPFLFMPPDVGLDSLAEYTLWKWKPDKANASFLRMSLVQVFDSNEWRKYDYAMVFTIGQHVYWRLLLNDDVGYLMNEVAMEVEANPVKKEKMAQWAQACMFGPRISWIA